MRLQTLKKALNEMVSILLNNQNIAKLVYWDNTDALTSKEMLPPAETLLQDGYISVFPKDASGISQNKVNTMISIIPDTFSFEEKSTEMTGNIYISTTVNLLNLNDNKFRLLELIDNIVDSLNKKKLSGSIILKLRSAVFDISTNFRIGYSISFTLIDQVNTKAVI